MSLSPKYSKMVSTILSTTFSVMKRFSLVSIATSLLSIFILKITKSTTVLYIHNIFGERSKAFLIMFLIDVDRVKLPRRPKNVIFEHIFKMFFCIVVFLLLNVGKQIDM